MDDLISRQAMVDAVRKELAKTDQSDAEKALNLFYWQALIQSVPSAEKHGKWEIDIGKDKFQTTYRCSECGHQFKWICDSNSPPVFNFCPKCGADMRKFN